MTYSTCCSRSSPHADEVGDDDLFGNVDEALEDARQRLQPASA